MFRLFLLLSVCSAAACTQRQAREPSSEDRLMRALAEPAGAIPEPLAFVADRPTAEIDVYTERTAERRAVRPTSGWYPWVYPVVIPTGPLPPVKSRVLTNPEGMPGGSRPGLLP